MLEFIIALVMTSSAIYETSRTMDARMEKCSQAEDYLDALFRTQDVDEVLELCTYPTIGGDKQDDACSLLVEECGMD